MRYLIIIILMSAIGCNSSVPTVFNTQIPIPNKILDQENEIALEANNFNFLEGKWIRINDEEGLQTYENWERKSPVKYDARSFTKANNQLVWEENSSLKIYHNKIVLSVKINPIKSVNFYCSTQNEVDYLKCTNQKNNYPKQIEYWMQNDTLNSKISGGGPDVSFIYIKNKNIE